MQPLNACWVNRSGALYIDTSTPITNAMLAAQLGELLQRRSWTLSCAESCTGGGLAKAITSVAGSSRWFEQSVVVYANQAKQNLLQVKATTLAEHGAVSPQVAMQMAKGVAQLANAQLAIGITGIAGPDGGSEDKPVGTVHIGFALITNAASWQLSCESYVFDGERTAIRRQAIAAALTGAIALLS